MKNCEYGKPVGIFSKLQVRYRSDRFSDVGTRWGAVPSSSPVDELDLQRRRMHEADDAGRRALNRALNKAIG